MITSAQQLKAKVRNLSKGDSTKAQSIMRSFAVERFLDRLAQTPFRENFILKGGVLVAALVGIENRTTVDIVASIKSMPLTTIEVERMVKNVISVQMHDRISFFITEVISIMEEFEYPGIRVLLEARLEKIRIPLKIDFSTDDVITPLEIVYPYKLLFEDRTVPVLAYNTETVLAEKLETVIARQTANTRMRDFYDIYALTTDPVSSIDINMLREAFINKSSLAVSW